MIRYIYLGRVEYGEALRLQEELVALRQQGRIGNTLLLLEHPPVLTLGRNANRSNILASGELLAARGVTLHEINRGGDVTYHGPGQLIGYPIFDLRSLRSPSGGRLPLQRQEPVVGGPGRVGPVDFVRLMEEALIRLCGEFGVPAGRIRGLTGVWCGVPLSQHLAEGEACAALSKTLEPGGRERKIAAIGIHVARGVTSHGFAFNVTTDLRDFALINPCGITNRPVTSLEQELVMAVAGEVREAKSLSLESIARQAAGQFGQVFNEQVLTLDSLGALRPHAQAATTAAPESPAGDSPAPVFPAEDTPLQVPREIERLRQAKDRPVNA